MSAPVTIAIKDGEAVSGIWRGPPGGIGDARAVYVFAHGAGAGMAHKSMAAIADGLAERGIAVLRYNFLYMEQGSKRPDPPARAHAVVRAAVEKAKELAPDLPLYAGGKSFGGRMTSQAQSLEPLPNVRGLVFFAFPLHPAGKPGVERAKHLGDVKIPMLFLQGTNDALAQSDLLEGATAKLKDATLKLTAHADHSFHVPAKIAKATGKGDSAVLADILNTARDWMLAR